MAVNCCATLRPKETAMPDDAIDKELDDIYIT